MSELKVIRFPANAAEIDLEPWPDLPAEIIASGHPKQRGKMLFEDKASGLSAGIWTDKGSRILWMADRLRAGVVWANTFNRFDPTSPFGGYKESGYGREGGRHGLEAYLAH